jgi:apolipoprotein N-acyltransferase
LRALRWWETPEFLAGSLSGLLLAAAVPPSPLGPLGFVALVPMLRMLFDSERIRTGAPLRLRTLILSFGLTQHLIKLHWLMLLGAASPLTFKWAMPLLLILLAFYATIPDAIVLWVLSILRKRREEQAIWWVPGLWIAAEWFRGVGEMGFPWLTLASTQLQTPVLVQLAAQLGELGVSLIVVWVNVLVTLTWMGFRGGFPRLGTVVLSRWWAPVTLVLLMAGVLVQGVSAMREVRESSANLPSLSVGVIQANVDLLDKWDPAKRDSTFVPYTELTRRVAAEGARLVIWPETAIPFDLPRRPNYYAWVRDTVQESGVFLYMGYVERQVDEEGRLDSYNSTLLMGDDGSILEHYRKMHLLPLGERMPFQSILPALGRIDFGQAEWTPGRERTVFDVDGHRFSALICFESIFSRFARASVQRGAGMLVNVTNDGWFGKTVLPEQHAWMSVLRAVENRVPLVRVANNGVSFVVRPDGRVEHKTPLFERAVFVTEVTPRPGGSFYSRNGDRTIFGLIAIGMVFLLAVSAISRRATG